MTFRKKPDAIPKSTRIALVEYELDYVIKEKKKSKLKLEKILNESKSTPAIITNDIGNNESQTLDFGKSTTSVKKFGRNEKERLIDVNFSVGKSITTENVEHIGKFLAHLEISGDPRANGVGNEGGHIAREMGDPGPVNGHYTMAIPDPMALNTTSEIFGHSLPKIQLHTFKELNHPVWDHRFIDGNCLQDNKVVVDNTPERLSMSSSFRQEISKFRPISGRAGLQGSSSSKLLGGSGSRVTTAASKADPVAAAHGLLTPLESNKTSRVTSANYSSKRSSRANSAGSQNGNAPAAIHPPVSESHYSYASPPSSSAHHPIISGVTHSHRIPSTMAGMNSSHNDSGFSVAAAATANTTTPTAAAGVADWHSPARYSPSSGESDSDDDFHFNRESILTYHSHAAGRGAAAAAAAHVIPSPLDNVSDSLWTQLTKELRESGKDIDYKVLIEINSLREPHEAVINCFGFICLLFGLAPTWQAARCVLFKELAALQSFLHSVDPMEVQVRRIKKALAFREEKLLNVTIHSLSVTCKPMAKIMRWITAFYKIGEFILPDYEAKQQQLALALEGSLVTAMQVEEDSQLMLAPQEGGDSLVHQQQQHQGVGVGELNTESFVTQVHSQELLPPRPRTTPAVMSNSSSHSRLKANRGAGRASTPDKTMRPSKSNPSLLSPSAAASGEEADEYTADFAVELQQPDYRQLFIEMTSKPRCKSAGNPRRHFLPQPFTLEPILQQKRNQEASAQAPLSAGKQQREQSPKKRASPAKTAPAKPEDAQSKYYNNLVIDADYNEEDLFEMFSDPVTTSSAAAAVVVEPSVEGTTNKTEADGITAAATTESDVNDVHSLQVSPTTPSPINASPPGEAETASKSKQSSWSKLTIPKSSPQTSDDKLLLTPTEAPEAVPPPSTSNTSSPKGKKKTAAAPPPLWKANKPPSPFLQPVPKKKILPSRIKSSEKLVVDPPGPLVKKKSTRAAADVSIAITLMGNAVQATNETNEEYGHDEFDQEEGATNSNNNKEKDDLQREDLEVVAVGALAISCDDLQPLEGQLQTEHANTSSPIPVVMIPSHEGYVSDISADVTARSPRDNISDPDSKHSPSAAAGAPPAPRHVLLTAASFHHQLDVFLSRTNSDKSLRDITGDEMIVLESPKGINRQTKQPQQQKNAPKKTTPTAAAAPVAAPVVAPVTVDPPVATAMDLVTKSWDLDLPASGAAVTQSRSEDYEASYEDFETFEEEEETGGVAAVSAAPPSAVASSKAPPAAVMALDFSDLRPPPEKPDTKLTFDPLPPTSKQAPPPSQHSVGAKVVANFRGSGKWLAGEIVRDRGSGVYDVKYDEGSVEYRVGEALIQLREEREDTGAKAAPAAEVEEDGYDFEFDAEEGGTSSKVVQPPTKAESKEAAGADTSPRADFKSYVFEKEAAPSPSYKLSAPSIDANDATEGTRAEAKGRPSDDVSFLEIKGMKDSDALGSAEAKGGSPAKPVAESKGSPISVKTEAKNDFKSEIKVESALAVEKSGDEYEGDEFEMELSTKASSKVTTVPLEKAADEGGYEFEFDLDDSAKVPVAATTSEAKESKDTSDEKVVEGEDKPEKTVASQALSPETVVPPAPVSTPTKRVTIALENNRVRVKSKDFNDDFVDGPTEKVEERPIRVGSRPSSVEEAVAQPQQQQLVQDMMHRADSSVTPPALNIQAQESGNMSTITMSQFDSSSYANLSNSMSPHPVMPSLTLQTPSAAAVTSEADVVSPPTASKPAGNATAAAPSRPENYDDEFDALFETDIQPDGAAAPPAAVVSVVEDRRSSIHREDAIYLQTIEAFTNHESDGAVFDPPPVEREESADFRTIFGSQVASPTPLTTAGGGTPGVGVAEMKETPVPLDTIHSNGEKSSSEESHNRATADPTPTPSHVLSHASTNISSLTMSQMGSGSVLVSEFSNTQMIRETPVSLPPTHSAKSGAKSPDHHIHVKYRPDLALHVDNPRDLASSSDKLTPTAMTFSMKQSGLDTGITQLEYLKKDYEVSLGSHALSNNSSISSAGMFFADIEDGFEVVGSPVKSPENAFNANSTVTSGGSKSISSLGSKNSADNVPISYPNRAAAVQQLQQQDATE